MKKITQITSIIGLFFLMSFTLNAQSVFDIMPNSLIATGNDNQVLRDWLDDYGAAPSGALLYRRSTHGASATLFHNLCDDKGPTLVVFKASNGQVFGGYTPNSWSSSSQGYKSSSQAFLFNLNSDRKASVREPQYSIYTNYNYGPTFGAGHHIYINSTMNGGYFNLRSFNSIDGSHYQSSTALNALTGVPTTSSYYSFGAGFITEIEVYQIKFNTSAPIIQGQNITVVLDVNGNVTITPQDIDTGTTDPDGPVTLGININSFNCDDLSGNSSEITPVNMGTVSQNSHSLGASYDPINEEFLFPHWSSPTVYRYSKERVSLGSFTMPHSSILDMWVDGESGDYFTTENGNFRIRRIERGTNQILWTAISTSGSSGGRYVRAITSDDTYVYYHAYRSNQIQRVNKSDGTAATPLNLGGTGYDIRSLVYANGKIYMGGRISYGDLPNNWNAIHIINAADGSYVSSFSTNNTSSGLAFDGEVIWVHYNNTAQGWKIAEGNAYFGAGGSNSVILTATDPLGNSRFQTFGVTVEDNIAPTISLNGDAIIDVIIGQTFTDPEATASDNCAAEIEITGTVDVNTLGEYILSYKAVDGSGNESEVLTRIVNVVVSLIPDIENLLAINEQCEAIPTPPTANNGAITATADVTFPISTQGTTLVTWTFDDGNGNTITQTQNVIIDDTTPPVLVCEPLIVDADPGVCEANVLVTPPTVTDNCDSSKGFSFDGDDDFVSIGTLGTAKTIEFWLNADESFNPSLEYNMLFNFNNSIYNYIATGNITGSISDETLSIVALNSGGGFGVISIKEELTGWNHIAIVSNGSSYNSIYVNGNPVTVYPSGSTSVINITSGFIGQRFDTPQGRFNGALDEVRIWDISRSQTEIQSNYEKELLAQPGLIASYNFNQGLAYGNNTGLVSLLDSSGNDNHGTLNNFELIGCNSNWVPGFNGYTLINNLTGTCDASGVYPVDDSTEIIWTATDANGNSDTCTQIITVEDNEKPIAIAQNIKVELDASGQANITAQAINNGSTDNCEIQSISIDKTSFICDNVSANNYALNFDGTKDFVVTPPHPVAALSLNTFTIEAWVKTTQNTPYARLVTKPAGGGQNYSLVLNNGHAHIRFDNGSGGQQAESSILINDGTWHHLAGVHNFATNTLTIYIDGVSAGSSNVTGGPIFSSEALHIGKFSSIYDGYFNGEIDEVRVWNVARTATEISDNYNHSLNGNETGLVAYFNFNEGSASTLNNLADNGVNGTLQNMDPNTDWVTGAPSLVDQSSVVTLTVTDIHGNTSTTTASVTVEDKLAPEVVGKDIEVTLTASGTVSIVANDVLTSGSDNCGPVEYSISQDTFGAQDAINSPVTIQLTGTDPSGNETTVPVIVTVIDPVPNAICQSITVYLDENGIVTIAPEDIDNGSNSVVGIGSLSLDVDTFGCENVGDNNTVVLTVISTLGAEATCEATVTVEDKVVPVVATQDITVQLDATGNASITPAMIDFGSTDNCEIATYELDIDSFDCTNITGLLNTANTVVVTLTVTDIHGNVNSKTATVTVEDKVVPVVATQDITVQLDATGNASITPAMIDFGSTDNCEIATYELDIDSFDCTNITGLLNTANTVVVTLTVTDIHGNVNSKTATVTVEDKVVPVVATQDITVQLDANGDASITPAMIDFGSTDNCEIATYELDIDSFDCTNITGLLNTANTVVVTLTVTDIHGNVNSKTATVTVEDKVVPVVATQDITVQLDATGNASITPAMIDFGSTDNCGIATYELDIDSFDCTDIQGLLNTNNTVVVTLTVTDIHGNVNSNTATVTVEDRVVPVVATQDITVQLDANGDASITPAMIDLGSTDNCGIATYELDIDSFDCTDIQGLLNTNNTVVVTLTVTDIHGNVNSNIATVTVEDTVVPVVNTQDITVQLDANGDASISPAMIDFGSTDNCGIATYELDIDSFDCNDIQGLLNTDNTVEVTLTVTDIHGNVNSKTATVTVEDKVVPVVATQDITVQLDATGNASITPAMIDFGSTDNCEIATYELDIDSFDCTNITGLLNTANTVVVTLTVTDIHGNVNSKTATVTVEDKVVPVVATQDITVQLDATGNASITPAMIDFGSTDNCEIATYELDIDSFDCTNITGLLNTANTVVVTLTVTDIHGNVNSKTATVTVEDKVVPVVATQDITVQLDATGNASITPAMIDFGSTDNCEIATYELDIDSFDCTNITGLLNTANTVVVTLTVTDIHGNVNSKTATVTVEDKVVPVVATQDITVQLDATGNASITPAMIDFGSTDNCEIATYELDIDSFDCTNITGLLNTANTVVVTLTVTDIHGNVNSKTATVTVEDTVKPVITCVTNDTRYIDPYETFYTADGTEFDATATDNCEIASITYTGGSPSTSGSLMDGVQLTLGTNTMSWTAIDVNGNDSYCTTIVEVIKRPTTLTYNGDLVEQYSDSVDLSATLTDDVTGDGVQGKTITFTIGTQSKTAVTNASGEVSTTLILTQDPANTYSVNAEFTEDTSYLGSSDNENFDITQENAIVEYTGQSLQATLNANSTNATVVLSANIQDITVNPSNTLYDPYQGDILNARLKFVDREGTFDSGWLDVDDLIDPVTGTVSYEWATSISGNNTSESFTIGIIVDTGYYIRDSSEDDTVVTIYIPTGDFITGGGYILPNASAGEYASTDGLKTNFGFNVKYNKKGTKLKGHMNVIFRRVEGDGIIHVYQIKSNAVQSLGVDVSDEDAQFSTFITKSNLKDITDPLYPVSLGGNLILKVDMTDRGEPGEFDSIAFNLTDGGSGELLYSSNWTGITTDEMQLTGGNLKVHSGFSLGDSTTVKTTSTDDLLDVNDFDNYTIELKSWPNPSDTHFNIRLITNNNQDFVNVKVFDITNKLVYNDRIKPNLEYKFGENLEGGIYIIKVEQAGKIESVRLVKY